MKRYYKAAHVDVKRDDWKARVGCAIIEKAVADSIMVPVTKRDRIDKADAQRFFKDGRLEAIIKNYGLKLDASYFRKLLTGTKPKDMFPKNRPVLDPELAG